MLLLHLWMMTAGIQNDSYIMGIWCFHETVTCMLSVRIIVHKLKTIYTIVICHDICVTLRSVLKNTLEDLFGSFLIVVAPDCVCVCCEEFKEPDSSSVRPSVTSDARVPTDPTRGFWDGQLLEERSSDFIQQSCRNLGNSKSSFSSGFVCFVLRSLFECVIWISRL